MLIFANRFEMLDMHPTECVCMCVCVYESLKVAGACEGLSKGEGKGL